MPQELPKLVPVPPLLSPGLHPGGPLMTKRDVGPPQRGGLDGDDARAASLAFTDRGSVSRRYMLDDTPTDCFWMTGLAEDTYGFR